MSNNALVAGATFTLSAEVRNDGEEAAAATTLRYYRSTGEIITTSDTEVGTDEVPVLAPSGTSGESVSLTATLPAGTYYYGACVDAGDGRVGHDQQLLVSRTGHGNGTEQTGFCGSTQS